ncbi:MAG TPA: hypothetical protein PLM24_05220 [Methanothrix sp.]|nr:hypothetical protein [Methanothrix sp.]
MAGRKEEVLGDEADEGSEGVGQRYVNEEVVPPGDGRKKVPHHGDKASSRLSHADLAPGDLD